MTGKYGNGRASDKVANPWPKWLQSPIGRARAFGENDQHMILAGGCISDQIAQKLERLAHMSLAVKWQGIQKETREGAGVKRREEVIGRSRGVGAMNPAKGQCAEQTQRIKMTRVITCQNKRTHFGKLLPPNNTQPAISRKGGAKHNSASSAKRIRKQIRLARKARQALQRRNAKVRSGMVGEGEQSEIGSLMS